MNSNKFLVLGIALIAVSSLVLANSIMQSTDNQQPQDFWSAMLSHHNEMHSGQGFEDSMKEMHGENWQNEMLEHCIQMHNQMSENFDHASMHESMHG
jgi:hypothetical protein